MRISLWYRRDDRHESRRVKDHVCVSGFWHNWITSDGIIIRSSRRLEIFWGSTEEADQRVYEFGGHSE